ncbi:MAG: GumC family protein, partial [Gemmatimonadota bacterium]
MSDGPRLPARPSGADRSLDVERPGLFSDRRVVYEDEIDLRDVWATLRRRRRTVFLTLALVVAATAAWTWLATPVWEASTLVRVDEQEGGVPVLDALASLQRGSELETEMRILRTRPILEDVVDAHELNLRVADPADVPREALFESIDIGRETPHGEYRIERADEGSYRIRSTGDETPPLEASFAPGDTVELPGGSFVLTDLESVAGPDETPVATSIDLEILGFQRAVDRLTEKLAVTRLDREANVVRVAYQTTDRVLAYEVPNAIAATFIERRNEVQKTEARSTVEFLTEQSDQIRRQLEAAEEELQAFRQQEQIVALGAEAEAQVERLAELQTERTRIDAERAALENLLSDIESETADPDYRRIAAFPTFLQNQAIADLLQQLSAADRTRTELLVRLTPSHPDVVGVEQRISDLEDQLGSIGRNYLNSLLDQVASLDAVLSRFGSELEEIPEKEVQFARLERQMTTLAELYTLLQTRLKEAQIAEAVEDPSVRVVETAILPIEPISPRPVRNLGLAGVLGLMLGIGLAFLREFMDTRLHSSDEIEVMFGLPTMARI